MNKTRMPARRGLVKHAAARTSRPLELAAMLLLEAMSSNTWPARLAASARQRRPAQST